MLRLTYGDDPRRRDREGIDESATLLFGGPRLWFGLGALALAAHVDAHAVEAPPDEEEHDGKARRRYDRSRLTRNRMRLVVRELDGQEAKERRKLDDRVHRDAARVFGRIPDRVAHDRRRVQLRALLLELHFDDLLRVVPCAAGIRHEERLKEAEESNRDQVTDEEEWIEERECERAEEDDEEDVEHPLLRVRRADLDHLLAVGDRRLLGSVELDVRLDELDGAIRAGRHGLRARTSEPVDDRAAGDHAEQERGMEQRELLDLVGIGQSIGKEHDDGEDHRRRAHDRGANEHRLRGGLERIARAVVLLEHVLRLLEVDVEAKVLLDLRLDVRNRLDAAELVDALRVVGDRTVRVNGERDRSHAEEPEGDQAEREDGRAVGPAEG